MHRMVIVVTAATLVVAGMWAANAAVGGGTTPARCLDTVWQSTEASTSSTTFVDVPGFTDSPESIFPMTIDVAAVVSGAPVEFRVLSTNAGDQTSVGKPGRTSFVPDGGGPDAFAFHWIERNQSAAVRVIDVRLQWRSPSGADVHLLRGDMAVLYDTEAGACIGST